MDNNTTKVLLAAIPSGAFVIVVALVIFGLSPGDCIEIEAPGGGKVTRCKPMQDSTSIISLDQIKSLEKQIEELKMLQNTQQEQLLTSLKQKGLIDDKQDLMTARSIFLEKQARILEQLRFLSSDEANILLKQLDSDKVEISKINRVAEDLITEGFNFSLDGKWETTGKIGIFDLDYEGQVNFNNGTYQSKGNLDGKHVTGSGTYIIDNKLGTFTLYPDNSKPTQYSFVDVGNNSFALWAPLDFEKIKFNKIIQ